MNAVNLMLSINNRANNSEYLVDRLTLQQIGFFERICRELLSFCCDWVDSTRIACLRASLVTVMNDEQIHSRLTIYSRIRRIFQEYAPNIQTISAPEVEELVETLQTWAAGSFKGSLFLKSYVPESVWKTLENLFESSLYQLEKIPLYSLKVVPSIDQDKMSFPLMAGWVGKESGHPFIAIKVERVLDQPGDASDQRLIILDQYQPNGSLWGGGEGEYGWYAIDGPLFFSGSGQFTYQDTGTGPTESQVENFARFKEFLQRGEGTDLQGVKWRITA